MSFRFRNFLVYSEILDLSRETYRRTEKFPKKEIFGLTGQIRRASTSIVLNLAEGSDRGLDKEFKRFINISIGSVNEVVAVLDIALGNNYIDRRDHLSMLERSGTIVRRLSTLARCLSDQSVSRSECNKRAVSLSANKKAPHFLRKYEAPFLDHLKDQIAYFQFVFGAVPFVVPI